MVISKIPRIPGWKEFREKQTTYVHRCLTGCFMMVWLKEAGVKMQRTGPPWVGTVDQRSACTYFLMVPSKHFP